MAFRTCHTESQGVCHQEGSEPRATPHMMPLSLELVPPVLCQSFGVPMHDSQFAQRSMMGFNMQQALRERADMDLLRFGHAEQFTGQLLGPGQQVQYSVGPLASFRQASQLGFGLGGGTGLNAQPYALSHMLQYANPHCTQTAQHQQHEASYQAQKAGHSQPSQQLQQNISYAPNPACSSMLDTGFLPFSQQDTEIRAPQAGASHSKHVRIIQMRWTWRLLVAVHMLFYLVQSARHVGVRSSMPQRVGDAHRQFLHQL
jgi:hypothetical protein